MDRDVTRGRVQRPKRHAEKTHAFYKITQHPPPPSRALPSRLLVLPLLASSSSSISAGRTDMWTTFGLSELN